MEQTRLTMKNAHDLSPEIRPHTNALLSGRPLRDYELAFAVGSNVADLPMTRTVGTIVTVWRCRSLRSRLLFLFTGRVTVTILGNRTAPLAVTVGDTMTP